MIELFQQSCGCSDCEAAVSPAAYLATLLDYALKHLRKNSTDKIDLQFLTDTFHQPFTDLPTDCDAVDTQVRQARICVEVLRRYVGPRPLADPDKEAALAQAEEAYRFAAYTLLLSRIGASYEEIRRIRTETVETRKALAERLGLALTEPRPIDPPGDELDRLFLDAAAQPPAPHLLTEPVLETLFGLPDTTRDPLSEAAKLGDDLRQITRWNLSGASWSQNTDPEGLIHLTLANPAANVFRVELYRDPARTKLVASGEIVTASGKVQLAPENGSRLSGVLEIAYVADSAAISIAAIPSFLSWQLRRLRTVWTHQDHPRDAYSDDASPVLPLIDPDLIGPDDFRTPFRKIDPTDPDRAFDIWLERRAFIDTTLNSLKTGRETNGLTAILKQVLGDPLPDLDGLLLALTKGGTTSEARAAADSVTSLGLSVASFTRLMAIRAKGRLAESDTRNEKVSPKEWSELYSILAQATKTKQFAAWRTEEQNAGIELGPETFWFSLRDPQEGDWPVAPLTDQPFIDPDVVKLTDLPEWLDGKEAIGLWNSRKAILEQIPKALRQERETSGFEALLQFALGNPAPGRSWQQDLDTLKQSLSSPDDTVRANATKQIETDLHLTVESFKRLMVIKAANDQPAPEKKPTAAEWAEVYTILASPRKLRHLYPQWLQEENAAGLVYWRAVKANLPLWRATVEARRAWQQALRVRGQRPVIDPTVMGPDDLRHVVAGDSAFDIWKDRYERSVALHDGLKATREAEAEVLAGLDKIIQEALGFEAAELEALDQERQAGYGIEKRLEQLNLVNGAFPYLMRIRSLARAGQPITDSEWDTVYATLARAKIQREFATQRAEEKEKGIFLTPDLFKIPQALSSPMPFLDRSVPVWLSTSVARSDWRDTLQARLDQEHAIAEGLRNAIGAVEEATLPALRDALIQASEAVGANLDEQAKWITERLLIDAKGGGCQITTRVAQAIETIQTLIFNLRTGQFKPLAAFPLSLTSDYFDEEWKWIGSYATWRAATFVFLYPENILQPSLRKYQTPAFEDLIKKTRTLRLDPESACQAAEAYADHFRDICSLEIEATCQASTIIYTGEGCDRQRASAQSMFYMFGRARSGKIYWSAYEAGGKSTAYGQTFWAEVPGFADTRVVRLIGAMPYRKRAIVDKSLVFAGIASVLSSYIYLFCITGNADKQTLKLARLNLDEFGLWDETVAELPIPPISIASTEIVPVQTQSEFTRPGLIFHKPDYYRLYYRQLNNDGLEWEQSNAEWPAYSFEFQYSGPISSAYAPRKIMAALKVNSDMLWLAIATTPGNFDVQLVGLKPGDQHPSVSRAWTFSKGAEFLGALPGPEDGDFGALSLFGIHVSAIYLFWRDSSGSHYRRFTTSDVDQQNSSVQVALADLIRIPPHSGSGSAGRQMLAYQRSKNAQAFYMYQYAEAGHRLVGSATLRAVPRVPAPLNIPHQVSAAKLQKRRQEIISAFALNADATPSALAYLREAYYFVPLHLALALQTAGQYLASLDWFRTFYDYEAPTGSPNPRNIYYGLESDAQLAEIPLYQQAEGWLLDPLNPHLIAATRRYAYTRFTIMSLVRCLLDFADSEFTQETGESLSRARTLYLTALDLLNLPELQQKLGLCDDLIGELKIEPGKNIPPEAPAAVGQILEDLTQAGGTNWPHLQGVVKEVATKLSAATSWNVKLAEANAIVQAAVAQTALPPATGAKVLEKATALKEKHSLLLTQVFIDNTMQDVSKAVAKKLFEGIVQPGPADPLAIGQVVQGLPLPPPAPVISLPLQFCIPPNPVLRALRMHADLNLGKLRTCRNIAGLKRQLEPYAAATDTITGLPMIGAGGQLSLPGVHAVRPTAYRYATLIERAKQLVQLAAQIEAPMLAALEKRDQEAYTLLKARQDLGLARASVKLQTLRIVQAADGVALARLQQRRAQVQANHYSNLLAEPISALETQALQSLQEAINYLDIAAGSYLMSHLNPVTYSVSQSISYGLNLGGSTTVTQSYKDAAATAAAWQAALASLSSTTAQYLSTLASYERRIQEWQLQEALAQEDVAIGEQQVKLANDGVEIVKQEKAIAVLQTRNAEDTVEFLTTKFTDVNLYDWMSGILEGVYRYFLQQATAMAALAQDQLTFERQEIPPVSIQADYWVVSGATPASSTAQMADRKGLTGSARLLQDIYQLDQYAFTTNQRKLQLTKTVSLAHLFPVEFQRFRETGVIVFATPMELFDRDFPGHYLRLIRRVRTSVIALIPPTQGIHATLAATGLSRVVIGPDIFQTVPIRRDPEFVALSSPANATGLFELEPQQPDMLLPFEGNGVDTTWEFRMPRAANQFDYRTIADVLVTLEYTALNSFDYRQQVIQALNPLLSADRSFSFRNQFADAWYDLHNPELARVPMTVAFKTVREDFPPNLDSLKIRQVLLYFARTSAPAFEVPISHLHYTAQGEAGTVGGSATSIDGIISTRRGNAGSWTAMIGKSPLGEWELALPNTDQVKKWFKDSQIQDILLVIGYAGRTPEWPA